MRKEGWRRWFWELLLSLLGIGSACGMARMVAVASVYGVVCDDWRNL